MRSLAFRGLRLPRLGAMLSRGFSSSHPLLLTRSTAAWAQDLSGNLFAFGVDQQRITNAGLTITGAATRLHGEAPTNGTNQSNTTSALAAEGLFNPLRIVSGGADWHRRASLEFGITSSTPVYVRMRVRAGTSGRMRLICRNGTANSFSEIAGTLSSSSATLSNAGALSSIVNRLLPNGDREITFTWTPNATVANGSIGIGPDSATSGQTIDIIGMQATSQFSEWIMGGAGTLAQTADVATLDLTGVSLAAGFMLRMDGTLLATPRLLFDQFYLADTGTSANSSQAYISQSSGNYLSEQRAVSVNQGAVTLGLAIAPPHVFSLVGAHGVDYVGGAFNGVVATPDTVAAYTAPTRLMVGSETGSKPIYLTITRITLFPEVPTTARVTAVAA